MQSITGAVGTNAVVGWPGAAIRHLGRALREMASLLIHRRQMIWGMTRRQIKVDWPSMRIQLGLDELVQQGRSLRDIAWTFVAVGMFRCRCCVPDGGAAAVQPADAPRSVHLVRQAS